MRNRFLIGVVGVIVLSGVSVGAYLLGNSSSSSNEPVVLANKSVQNDEVGITLQYNESLQLQPLSSQDIEDNFIFRFKSVAPDALVTIRQETGLKTITTLANIDMLSLLGGNIERALPDRYPNVEILDQQGIMVAGEEGLAFTFTYSGPSNEQIKQLLVVLPKDLDTAIYVSAQSRGIEFDTTRTTLFDPLLQSIRLD